MIEFLSQVAKNARKQDRGKAGRVAVAARVDQSTLYRFERGNWPANADQVIEGYAAELGIDPITLWRRAMEKWLASEPENIESAEKLAALEKAFDDAQAAAALADVTELGAGDAHPRPPGALGRDASTDPPTAPDRARKPNRPAAGRRRDSA